MKYIPKKLTEIRSNVSRWMDVNRESVDPYLAGMIAGMALTMFIAMPTLIEGMNSRSQSDRQFNKGLEFISSIYQTRGGNEMLNPIYQEN